MDEKEAIAHIKQGDLSGLEVLVYLYQVRAVRSVCLIVGDPAVAEDIVQAAFIRVGEKISQFDSQRAFGPWFLRSVVNDALKVVGRRKRIVSLDTMECAEILELADPALLPEEMVEAEETNQAVWRAVEQLPPNQRAAIVMRYYLRMGEEEMSVELDGPKGTVKWWLHAARERLKMLLQPLRLSEPPSYSNHKRRSEKDEEPGDKR